MPSIPDGALAQISFGFATFTGAMGALFIAGYFALLQHERSLTSAAWSHTFRFLDHARIGPDVPWLPEAHTDPRHVHDRGFRGDILIWGLTNISLINAVQAPDNAIEDIERKAGRLNRYTVRFMMRVARVAVRRPTDPASQALKYHMSHMRTTDGFADLRFAIQNRREADQVSILRPRLVTGAWYLFASSAVFLWFMTTSSIECGFSVCPTHDWFNYLVSVPIAITAGSVLRMLRVVVSVTRRVDSPHNPWWEPPPELSEIEDILDSGS